MTSECYNVTYTTTLVFQRRLLEQWSMAELTALSDKLTRHYMYLDVQGYCTA